MIVHRSVCCFVSLPKRGWNLKPWSSLSTLREIETRESLAVLPNKPEGEDQDRVSCSRCLRVAGRTLGLALLLLFCWTDRNQPARHPPALLNSRTKTYCTRFLLHLQNETFIYYFKHILSLCFGVTTMITSKRFFYLPPTNTQLFSNDL